MFTRSCGIAMVVVACSCAVLPAQQGPVGFRQLTSTHPVAVQAGTSGEIVVRCNFTLDGAHSVLFDRPGIRMTYAETKPIDAFTTARTSVGVPFRFHVEVPADQPPGLYEFRVATRKAVSSVGQLLVTELPVISEPAKGENGTPATAMKVTVPAALCGTCEAPEDVDCFRFQGQAGQELTFQVYAQRVTDKLHSMVVRGPNIYLMDPILTLYGPNGQVVAQNDNHFGGDSFFAVKLPTSGDYVLEVRDARYVGNPRYTYCVEVSDRPFVAMYHPLGVRAGETAEVEVIGHLLGDVRRARVTAPPRQGVMMHRVDRANAAPLVVSPHPQVVEAEAQANDAIADAMPVSLPVGINGRLGQAEDVDYWSFSARKGQVIQLEVEARRHGSPLDSVIEIYAADGKKLAENDDPPTRQKDSRLSWTVPADGTYFVAIRDLLGRGGPDFVYHLSAEVGQPDFEVHGEYYYAMLAPGTSMIWFARIERLNGFDGPVRMDVEGLPLGVTVTPVTIPRGMNHCSLILSASADAPIGAALVRTVGHAVIPSPDGKDRQVTRIGRVTCEQQGAGGGQSRWPINTQIVGVVEPMDLTRVEASPAAITLKPGEKAAIKVKIERRAGFNDPVALDMAFSYFNTVMGQQLPPNVRVAPESKMRLSGKTLEGTVVLEALPNALPVEKLPIAVLARVSISFSITTNYCSNPIELTVLPAK